MPAATSSLDIVLLAPEWQPRALLRAQLIEEGYEVLATDAWPAARRYLRPGIKPRLVVVDLRGLPEPDRVLEDLSVVMKPERVFVLTALGTVDRQRIERLGFHVIVRPTSIRDIVKALNDVQRERAGSD